MFNFNKQKYRRNKETENFPSQFSFATLIKSSFNFIFFNHSRLKITFLTNPFRIDTPSLQIKVIYSLVSSGEKNQTKFQVKEIRR